ncbi:MAG TPA: zinc-dependent metalloprotease [Acidimicrobiales bacterium]|nr:zinc-dependent metalloprotease [Acidimicrobiales bacterium]
MSEQTPFPGSGGPFGDLMRDLARLLSAQGPVNWEVARQLAAWTATEGQAEANPDPIARIRTEELLRVADMHVAEATGLATSRRGWLSVRCTTKTEWAASTLEAWRELLSRLAVSMGGQASAAGAVGGPGGTGAFPGEAGMGSMDQLLGNLPQVLGPLMFGAQAGTMVGHLANRAMGQYDMPMPAPEIDELLNVPVSVDGFAGEWSLPADDVRMYVCLRDVTYHSVLCRPHIGTFFREHLSAYASAFQMDLASLQDKLGGIDPTDPSSFQRSLGDPDQLLAEMQSDQQRRLLVPFSAFVAVLSGYTDFVIEKVGRRLVGSYGLVAEAFRRRQVEDGPGQRALGKLLGVEVDQGTVENGRAFVNGVVERAGEDALRRLWESDATLPTPAEIGAPGLWLARMEYAPGTGSE